MTEPQSDGVEPAPEVPTDPVPVPGTLGCPCDEFDRPDTEEGRAEMAVHCAGCPAVAAAEAAYVALAPVEPVTVPSYESNGKTYLMIDGEAVPVRQ